MPVIIARQLIQLRNQARLSQDALAQKAGVSLQTIYRLENEKTKSTHGRNLTALADALKVKPEALTQPSAEGEQPKQLFNNDNSELKVRIADRAHNALSLVSKQYAIPASRIIELAPFLFDWAAQASLKQRQARLNELGERYEAIAQMGGNFRHLSADATNHWNTDQIFDYERKSIAKGDLFGESIPFDGGAVGNSDAEEDTDNPSTVGRWRSSKRPLRMPNPKAPT